jgi:hypothetical protein
MKFGAFDHLDRGIVTTSQQYEERLRLVEAYEEASLSSSGLVLSLSSTQSTLLFRAERAGA